MDDIKKIKLLILGKYFYPEKGGIEDHLFNLCAGLNGKFPVCLRVLVANRKPKTEIEYINGVEVIKVANLREINRNPLCPTLSRWINKSDFDIINLHFPNPLFHLAYLLSKKRGKLIINWHSDIVKQKIILKFYGPFLMAILRIADAIIVSNPNYVEHSPFLSRFKQKCRVIPYCVDLDKFAYNEVVASEAKRIQSTFGDRIVLFVGRLRYYKGLKYLIEAMRQVEARLIIIGKGELNKELQHQVEQLNLKNKVFFLGEVSHEDLVAYYYACSIFVLPAIERSEAFGIVQLEAMACGRPVISTCLKTGVDWVNQDRVTGIIVPPRDSGSLARAMNTILNSPSLRMRYGENGKERIRREFTKELFIKNTFSLYEHVLHKQ